MDSLLLYDLVSHCENLTAKADACLTLCCLCKKQLLGKSMHLQIQQGLCQDEYNKTMNQNEAAMGMPPIRPYIHDNIYTRHQTDRQTAGTDGTGTVSDLCLCRCCSFRVSS